MKEVFLFVAAIVAAAIVIAAGDDKPITPIPTECPATDSKNFTVHVAHPTNCSLFYTCQRGYGHLTMCPYRDQEGNRLHFNPLLQVCDWPENAGCTSEDNTTPKPTTPKPTTAKPTTPKPTTPKPTTPKQTTPKPTTPKPTTPKPTTPKPTTLKPTTPKPTTPKPTTPKPTTPKPTTPKPTTPKPTTPKPTTAKPTTPKPTTPKPTTAKPTTPKPTTPKPTTPKPTTPKPTTPKPTTPKPTTPKPTTPKPTTPKPTTAKPTTPKPTTPKPTTPKPITPKPTTPKPTTPKTTTPKPTTPKPTTPKPTTPKPTTPKPTTPKPTTPKPTTPKPTTSKPTTPKPTPPTPKTTTDDPWYTIGEGPDLPSNTPASTDCPIDLLYGTKGIKLPHESDCRLYYVCENGKKVEKECDEGLFYDPVLQMCDWASEVDCQLSTVKPTEPTKPKPSECPKEDNPEDPVLLPHECQCDKYYVCKNEDKIVKKCPPGEGFNAKLGKCVSIKYADCFPDDPEKNVESDAPAPEPQPPANKLPQPPIATTEKWENPENCVGTCPARDPIEYTVLLENLNCRRFCKCSNGKPYVYTCNSDLEFSPTKKVCTYPETANCRFKPSDAKKSEDAESAFFARLFHWSN